LPPEDEPPPRCELKFERFVAIHLRHLKAEHAVSTFKNENYRLRNVVIPAFRDRLLADLTRADIEEFLTDLVTKGASPATRNRYVALLSVLFERARTFGHIEENPVRGIRRLREQERPVPSLSVEEQNALIDACPDRIRDVMLAALDTGCRMGELLRLEWQDVDLAQGILTVRKSKSGKTRTVPLTSRLRTRLTELRALRIVPMEGPDRVFARVATDWSGSEARLFKRAAASVGHPSLRPHDLRHLAAVNLVRAGVPLPDVGRWLGHSRNSLTVTMRYARHAPGNAAESALALLECRLARGRAVEAR
jgi:integrase